MVLTASLIVHQNFLTFPSVKLVSSFECPALFHWRLGDFEGGSERWFKKVSLIVHYNFLASEALMHRADVCCDYMGHHAA